MRAHVRPAFMALLVGASLAAGGEAAKGAEPSIARLIERLGSEDPAARQEAMEALAARGEEATEALEKAREAPDPEVRWRAAEALHRIRWRISPEVAARIGDLMHDFRARSVAERERICHDLAMAGLDRAVPTLTRILKTDPSRTVRQGAARALVLLGDPGLEALLEAGAKTEGLERYTVAVHIHLGNSYLERKEFEKALQHYRRALEAEPDDSIAHYNVACVYAQTKELEKALDALERAVECGYRDLEWMEKDPDLDNLRELPRYKALVKKLQGTE
ncbi:MAG: TPR end-of-group domain-containing protein [Candidatus Brocadiia bacterium]